MTPRFKSPADLAALRRASQLAARIVEDLRRAVTPGVTKFELDQLAARLLADAGARSTSLNHPTGRPGEGFPGVTCLSVNEEVTHGLPTNRALAEGDIITLDVGVILEGFCGSRAVTVPVGPVSDPLARLLQTLDETLDWAIANVQPHRKWSDVARLMQSHVEQHGFGIVREFIGHGIGRRMIEEPGVPAFVDSNTLRKDFRLRPGMTLTIEAMITLGRRNVVLLEDRWTVVTEDHSPAAHARHVIAVTDDGAEVLSTR